ncbi:N-terminal half of MaoC dehydratase [Frankia sp. AiPs1]|uniref:FAS1-like dehydratase domain-containing protein n=1 Tax=Frankia sp. AiPa1 TaxID=573492 RepID=UPI00202AED2A|nr:MaoC family dehydratase N-terminal domain-containing protein [Frankia sp. AiPa1]MCL9762795.1 MaoC family dehydratase N-terminal domain-containing protein [Frankia sp. AiPa1]
MGSDEGSGGYTMPLERGKIREFAAATGSASPAYVDDPAPPIPPTFLRTQIFWSPADGSGPKLPDGLELDVRRILHGQQEYIFFGPPPRAGEELTVTSRVESVTEKQGRRGGTMTVIVFVDDFANGEGALVAQGRQTVIQTGRAPS